MKIKISSVCKILGWVLCLLVGFYFADLAYDFENYRHYILRPQLTASRFAFEPSFVWLSSFLYYLSHDSFVATQALFSISFFVLGYGVLHFGYCVVSLLRVRSTYIVPVCFILSFPFLVILAIVPRQAFATGIFFIAVSVYLSSIRNKTLNKAIGLRWLKLFALIVLAISFHNLSSILMFCIFAWLFFRWSSIFTLTIIILLFMSIIVFFGDSSGLLPVIGTAKVYFGDSIKQTGFYRTIVFLFICVTVMIVMVSSKSNHIVFGSNVVFRVAILLSVLLLSYITISFDIARMFLYPTIIFWFYIGCRIVAAWNYTRKLRLRSKSLQCVSSSRQTHNAKYSWIC